MQKIQKKDNIKNMNKFIFDVDGTLTPSRGKIDSIFEEFFLLFCQKNSVYLVTGSDYAKTLEQLGKDVCLSVKTIYNCSGNEVRKNETLIKSSDWKLPKDAKDWLLNQLSQSVFLLRTGNHIEERTGTANFSIVGRNATLKERMLYVQHDSATGERERIASEFNQMFSTLDAKIGGETGIDIFLKEHDKRQILDDFNKIDKLFFFGDRMSSNGNDYPLSYKIELYNLGVCFAVRDWRDTFERLVYLQEARIAA